MSKLASNAQLVAGSVSIFVTVFAASSALAQSAASIPDFSSNATAWGGGVGLNFIPVRGSPPPVSFDPAHPYYNNAEAARLGVQPSFRIADLTHPNLKQWAKDVMKKDNDEVLAGKIAYTPGSSCKPAGVPTFMLDGGPFYFLQTPKKVTIIAQGDQQVRHVYMDVPHSAKIKPSWYGESVGHYEGDTLVIDTIGQNTNTFVDHYRTPHTEKLHVVERWRMVDDGKQMEVLITINDPETYNESWQAMLRWRRVQQRLPEQVCAEGNLYLFDWGMPVAKTPDF